MSPYLAMHMTCTCFTLVFSKPLGFPAIYLKKKKNTHTTHTNIMKKKHLHQKRGSPFTSNSSSTPELWGTFSSRPPWRCSPSSKPEIPESQKTERKEMKVLKGGLRSLLQDLCPDSNRSPNVELWTLVALVDPCCEQDCYMLLAPPRLHSLCRSCQAPPKACKWYRECSWMLPVVL